MASGFLLLVSILSLATGVIGRRSENGVYLVIFLIVGCLGGLAWLTHHPDSPWLAEAGGWPIVGPMALRFQDAYLGPEPTVEVVEMPEESFEAGAAWIEHEPSLSSSSKSDTQHQVASATDSVEPRAATQYLEPSPEPLPEAKSEPLPAEDLPLPTFQMTVDVSEVLVEVVVTDRRGDPVLGLEKEDFQVFLAGQSMAITSLRYQGWYAKATTTKTQASPETESPPDSLTSSSARHRIFILLFHDLIFMGDKGTLGLLSQRMRAGRGIRRWVREEMQKVDLVAMATYDSKLRLMQDFTPDGEVVLAALERVMSRSSEQPVVQSEVELSLSEFLPSGRELLEATTDFKQALRVLAEAAGHTPGRKHLLLFTIGTDLGGVFSRALFDPKWQPSTLELLQHNEVIVYPLNLTPRGVEHPLLAGLENLAYETGGFLPARLQHEPRPQPR